MPVPAIHCRRLAFAYPGSPEDVFTDLDLSIDTGWRAALVGRNGRGKTTLLRLLAGELQPDRGGIEQPAPTISFPGADPEDAAASARAVARAAVAPFESWERDMEALLAAGDDASMLRYSELLARFQDAGGYEIDARLERELDGLDIAASLRARPFGSLSGGERTRVLLAALFAAPAGKAARYPLIDEPTNHLDLDGRRLLAAYLATKPGFLLVSHDRAFLDASCDHVVALNPDTVDTERTSFSAWRRRHLQRRAAAARRNVLLRREIARHEDTAQFRRDGALRRESEKGAHADKGFIGHRAAKQMKRAIAAESRAARAAEARRETLVNLEKHRELKLEGAGRAERTLAVANDLAIERGGRRLLARLSFTVASGDRIAIAGGNGSGKTTLLEELAAPGRHGTGTLSIPGRLALARAYQAPLWSRGLLRDHLRSLRLDEVRFRQVLSALGFGGAAVEQPLERMSDGQRKKIDLARSFVQPADLLLWDEPLNYLDIDARESVEEALLRHRPTLVFVEHDAAFIDRVATEVIELARYAA